jgi:hypothetical protein
MNIFSEAKKVLDKDGKVNPLGPYGKQKLTGREVSTYFRRNPVKDATIKKAVEVALDLGGADTIARSEIKKFYGDAVLKSKEVQNALKYANESFTYNQSLNQISEENLVEKNLMPDIQKIVDTKGAAKVGGIMVDMFTASMINQIYNKVNDQNKKRMEKSNISTLVDIAQRMMQKSENNPLEEETLNEISQGAMISKAIDIAVSMGGNMTGAVKRIEAIKKGLSKNKNVKKALELANEELVGEDAVAKAKLTLKHTQDMQKLKDKQAREKESMSESDMQNVDDAPKDKWKALGFSQHPHKGFEDERLPKDMRDFRKKAKTPSQMRQMRVEDAYRQMWEDGEKYAPQLDEVTDKEINAMKQLSKDMEKIKKDYFKIAKMGDKTLQLKGFNTQYESILKAQQEILKIIGDMSTMKSMSDRAKKNEEVELEEKLSKADLKMIDMMYDKKGKLTDVGKAVMNYKPGDNIRKIVQNLNNKK